ncbi:ATP-binding cassette domain-containing protein, partial [Corynebacterium bovis]|uniref:ATP-binding cassette domain-containing protein n=1 Tax=Corynebacterium bovis TaxID=36808 RepID=UPI0031392F6A
MPVVRFVWGTSGSGLSDHAWRTAERTGAAWVGNDAAAHISLLRATVAEELAFAMEQRGVPGEEMRRRVDAALTEWDLRGVAGDDPVTLSTGQTRRVAVAQALLAAPGALVLDCPLDGFDADAVRTLRRVLAGVPGPVTVYDRVRTPLADDAAEELELRPDGTLVAARAPEAVVPAAVLPEKGPVAGTAEVSAAGTAGGPVAGTEGIPAASPVLEAREVSVRHGSFRLGPVSLAARGGEVTHLAGPNGAGKTTLMLAVLGLLPHAGRITAPVAGWAPGRSRCGTGRSAWARCPSPRAAGRSRTSRARTARGR